MSDVQKVFAAHALMKAKEKIRDKKINSKASSRVVIQSIEESSMESNDGIRDIWSNLLANELTRAGVHPEFPTIMKKLSSDDAIILSKIWDNNKNIDSKKFAQYIIKIFDISSPINTLHRIIDEIKFDVEINNIDYFPSNEIFSSPKKEREELLRKYVKYLTASKFVTSSHEHLERLGLIRKFEDLWIVTKFGQEFILAVSEPSSKKETLQNPCL